MGIREIEHNCLSFACAVFLCYAHYFGLSAGPSGHHRTTATIKKVKRKAINSKRVPLGYFPICFKIDKNVWSVSKKKSCVSQSYGEGSVNGGKCYPAICKGAQVKDLGDSSNKILTNLLNFFISYIYISLCCECQDKHLKRSLQ